MRVWPKSGSALWQVFLLAAAIHCVPLVEDQVSASTPPCILRQPVNQTVPNGSNVTFSVIASGSGPLTYQWRFNGTVLEGATNTSLMLASAQATNAGSYAVDVAQPGGSVQSVMATLTVVDHPVYAIDWPDLRLTQVGAIAGGPFGWPYPSITQLTHSGDGSGRLFVVWQFGRIYVLNSTGILATPFLDIGNRLPPPPDVFGEQGLLSIVFPPCYASKGYFYVNYTRGGDGATVVSRFSVTATNANVADPASEQILLTIPQPYANHNGGQLMFGQDGFLYIGMGDGGSEGDPNNQAQNPASLLGKLLRIDVESTTNGYVVPGSNPFVGNSNYRPEIWAVGLRNPWRFSFDRLTGDLYIGDVGQDLWEEIDFQPASSHGGENYGWRIKEGNHDYNVPSGGYPSNSLTPPIAEYGHGQNLGCSVTGGFVYRGPSNPRMQGMYFFADWCLGRIWGLKNDGTNWQSKVLVQTNEYITTFGEDEAGRLYLGVSYGRIYQISDGGSALPPLFAPPGGIYNSQIVVAVTSPTAAATIRYTTDGRDPGEMDPILEPGNTILVSSNNSTLKARSYRSDLLSSAVGAATYTLFVRTPDFDPPSGPITNGTKISITSATPDASIRYTTDGSEPTESSMLYTGPIPIAGDTTVKAKGFRQNFNYSGTRSVFYPLVTVATPDFDPASGPITNNTPISITCVTAEAIIRFTTNGSDPDLGSTIYSGAFRIRGGTTVKAKAYRSEYHDSAVRSVVYPLLAVATPNFSPPTGPITNRAVVSISCSTPNSQIRYTLDGTEPNLSSSPYSQPVEVLARATLKAKAFNPDLADSLTRTSYYGLVRYEKTLVMTLVGSATAGYQNGFGTNAQLSSPQGICIDRDGTLYFTDSANQRIRKISTSDEVITIAGSGTVGNANGNGSAAQFNFPVGICLAADRFFYVADTGNNLVRKVDFAGNVSSFFAVSPGPLSYLEPDSSFHIFIASNLHLYKFFTNAANVNFGDLLSSPLAVGIDSSGNVFGGHWNGTIFRISPAGDQQLFSGTNVSAFNDGLRSEARFLRPTDITVDKRGNVYVSDGASVRKIGTNGNVTTLAGSGLPGYVDGPGEVARFGNATGLCVDDLSQIYVCDSSNNVIRKIVQLDMDGDGIPDAEEGGSTPFVVGVDDRFVDSDGDGVSNASEYLAGTDPKDPNSFFGLRNVARVNGSCLGFEWVSASNRVYFLEWSSDLQNWTTFDSLSSAQPQVLRVTNCPAANVSSRFYRVRVSTP